MLGRVERRKTAWAIVGLVVAIPAAMYVLNPFNTPSKDPRARILGFTVYRVPARSMEPTLKEGDIFVVNVAALRNRDPAVGEIIVFEFPPNPEVSFVKRVVASGGSTLEMRKGVIYVDGKILPEPWLPAQPLTETEYNGEIVRFRPEDIHADLAPTLVPPRHFFVLGDNRGNSSDSRAWGFVPRENVIGVNQN
jgi:signal peptidase I